MKKEIQEKIMLCLSEILGKSIDEIEQTAPDITLTEIGMTSLTFIEFIVKLEEALGIEVLDSDLLFDHFENKKKLFETLSKYIPGEAYSLKKVLILDADNVLWKGISGEEELRIDETVREFQEFLLTLHHRGVLLCLCSKNQPELIEQAFASPDMLLNKEHFAVFLANRHDKASNITMISKELNLSPDSFVFADDSDYELGFIALNLPEITTVKVDYTAPDFFEKIAALFANVQASSKLNRTQLYREQKEREKEKHRFTSVQEYNRSLKTKTICRLATADECERLAELSARTHQFNLSNMQYTPTELESLLSDHDSAVFSLSVRDKYGDMGIIGMAVVKKKTIEAFLLSCRVFDRDFELVLLDKIKETIGTSLFGIYRATEKNQQYTDFYKKNGVTVI